MKKTADCTDLGNSERFVAQHASTLRFVAAWGKWLVWDGRRWNLDHAGAADECAKATARALMKEASEAHGKALASIQRAAAEDDDELRRLGDERRRQAQPLFDWAVQSLSAPRIAAMVQLARSAPELAVTHEQLDGDPWLLNCENGTLDLRTGKLRPHRREDLITKLAPVAYDPNARAPRWAAFLAMAMAENAELVDFLARVVGYSLTGVIREHVLVFHFGGGANGKSTFLAMLQHMLGDYAIPAPRGLLFRSRGERHPTELAALFGARFVVGSEVEEGQAFDESLVKDLTGGDKISCRRMREDFWGFVPTHKLTIAGNHKPLAKGDDEGIWRRLCLVPWTVTVPPEHRNTALPEILRAELPGILSWAVRGCLDWQKRGLDVPSAVREASAEYREESDQVGEFLANHCTFDSEGRIARKEIRERYEDFCKENGSAPLGAKRFASRLRSGGAAHTPVRLGTKVVDGWRGVRLKTDAERERRGEGTCRDRVQVSASYAPAREPLILQSTLQDPYVPADDWREVVQ